MKKRANADSTSTGADEGWAVITTLMGGFVLWGAIGWALDRWFGTHFLTPIGLIVGMALGIYAVVARHGGFAPPPTGASTVARRADPYNLQLYRRSRMTDPPPGPPPANPRRETECP